MGTYRQGDVARARKLRTEMTDAERKLWSIVRNRQLGGAKFVRQLPVGPYVADFACRDANLIVEVDGGQHAGSKSDARRTAVLATFGYRVVRFWNTEVLTNPAGVYDRIMEELATAPLTHRFTTATANEGTRTKRA